MRTEYDVSRRGFLRGAGAVALSASLASACGGSTGNNSVQANSKVALPAYIPYGGVTPDLPPGPNLLPGFFGYPQNLVTAYPNLPAAGAGTVNILVDTFTPVPPGVSRNKFWQALNARTGADLKFNMVPDSDYSSKVASTVAGGDLPDIVMLPSWTPQLPRTLKALFQDLSEFLSGDAVKAYRSLANIPAFSWHPMVYNGGIYGVPTPRASVGSIMFTRDDLITARSLNGSPGTFQEFLELCQGLTDAKNNRWALGNTGAFGGGALQFALEIAGAPNGWQLQGGKLTNALETEAYPEALNIVASMVKKGLFHPDAFSGTLQQQREWFGTGKVALNLDGYAAWDILRTQYPTIDIGGMVAPAYSGGRSRHFTGPGSFAVTAIKKGSPARIKQLIAICDWLAAPFGTTEQLFRKFGVQGTDYTLKNGLPTLTSSGTANVSIPLQYLTDASPILGPGPRDVVSKQYAFHQKLAPLLVADPTVGLYSTTNDTKGAAMNKILADAQGEILRGKRPVSSWTETARQWRSAGGAQVAAEFAQAYAQQH